jgi:L-ascorbate metabolism protein UlaG (beta-lactamase superfamily)
MLSSANHDESEAGMRWRRLGWAGLEVEASGASIVVDHLLDPGIFKLFFSPTRDELVVPEPGRASAALVTHLHRDHADVAAIEQALRDDAIVLRPPRRQPQTALDEVATGEAEAALAASSLSARMCEAGDRLQLGPFAVTALPASDGLGSPQVSWLIEAGGRTLVHAGDTLWHGGWWDIAAEHGPIDLAFLPGNGVEVAYPQWQPPVAVPAVMTPEQAVEAARALQARTLVPIHHNRTFEHPDYYRPATDAERRIAALAAERGVEVRFAKPGEWSEVGATAVAGSKA